MKLAVPVWEAIEIKVLRIDIPFRRLNEDEAVYFRLPQDSENVRIFIDIDEGRIIGWPEGKTLHLQSKVIDEGAYVLFDEEEKEAGRIDDNYIPDLIPNYYGDYLNLKINSDGVIENWPSKPCFKSFFPHCSGESNL